MTAQILIAEDEPDLRHLFGEQLSPHYTVVTAAHGLEALRVLKTRSGIQLLLSDIRMPGMNGHELAEEALRHNPELKVVFMSAFDDEMPPAPLLRAREIRTLHKPFGMARLRNLAGEVLSRP